MKTREEVARFIENQLSSDEYDDTLREKNGCRHYGYQDLRTLMDFIYEGEPKTEIECIQNASHLKYWGTDKYKV